jgi:sugar phosphate isomerase/epimerase
VDTAHFLGCHAIRVNARSSGGYDEQMKLFADGLRQLAEYADAGDVSVLVENHGGFSSNGQWLAGVMRLVDHPRAGTLPDFGNWFATEWGAAPAPGVPADEYDRYRGVAELMPFARGVSAKSYAFDAEGREARTDYFRMMKVVLDAGFRGYVGVEYEGDARSEGEGLVLTKLLLERVRDHYAAAY